METVIVPSKSTPKIPNIVLFYANGKASARTVPVIVLSRLSVRTI